MADKAKKISELTAATGAANTDLLVLVQNTAGTAVTKKIVANTLFNALPTNILPTSNAAQSLGSSTKAWQFVYTTNISFPGVNGSQNVPFTSDVLRVSNTANVSVNSSVRYVFCDPGTAGGNVMLTIPNGSYDGKEYNIKNVNTGSHGINVQAANGSVTFEDTNGTFVSTVTIDQTHGYIQWVWDATALKYRIFGHNL